MVDGCLSVREQCARTSEANSRHARPPAITTDAAAKVRWLARVVPIRSHAWSRLVLSSVVDGLSAAARGHTRSRYYMYDNMSYHRAILFSAHGRDNNARSIIYGNIYNICMYGAVASNLRLPM